MMMICDSPNARQQQKQEGESWQASGDVWMIYQSKKMASRSRSQRRSGAV